MIIKADIAQVSVGPLTIEGLMSENADFGVAVPQTAALFQFDTEQASRSFKVLMGDWYEFEKWRTPLNPKPVNVFLLKDFERLLFVLAQKGNKKAVEMWNSANPDKPPFSCQKEKVVSMRMESRVETRIEDLYSEWNPQRQVVTDFGIADLIHDHGVVEVKEFKSISSAHKALGQAMSYGSILRLQPEVVLFNVPDNEVERVIRLFTAVGILVLIYTVEGTKKLIARKLICPNFSNADEIAFQVSRKRIESRFQD